ncbi:uncharacterized protein LOC117326532 [Pecten maximus]|uniref:uncharacterized protein LOC117326532 n=1 Tax=Pecten maximus TaxID=6579 RepID=UPI0014582A6A|nr:uncharacterized protein LOC117326532 [Pecten maximus]
MSNALPVVSVLMSYALPVGRVLMSYALPVVFTLCSGEEYCGDYLVSGPQGVPDSALSASSFDDFNGLHQNPACGRLYMYEERSSSECSAPNAAAWCGKVGDTYPYIQVKFNDVKKIAGVALQRRKVPYLTNHDVSTYQVLVSADGDDWEYVSSEGVDQTFYGPTDAAEDTITHSVFSSPVLARYVRIKPMSWTKPPPYPPCLRFDVIGCAQVQDTGKRRFAYLPLPAGSIHESDMIKEEHANDLRECSIRCHRDVTCRSFSYSDTYSQCKTYNVNKYTRLESGVDEKISDKPNLYYFDMTSIDLHMIIDPETRIIYKVITQRHNKEEAMLACANFEMRLLVVNSQEKLDLLYRVKSSSLALGTSLRVNGGWYAFEGVAGWWDGGNPPRPVKKELVRWNTAIETEADCLLYNRNELRRNKCSKTQFSICEI